MTKAYRLDFLTTFLLFFMIVAYIYIFFIFEGASLLTLLLRYGFIVVITLLFLLVTSRSKFSKSDIILLFPAVLFNIVYFLRIDSADAQTIVSILIQIAFVMLMYVFYALNWKKYQIKMFSRITSFVLPLLLASLYFELINANTVGGYAYFLAFFSLLYLIGYSKNFSKFRFLLIVSLMSAIIFFSETRSIFLAVAFSLITFLIWKVITRYKILFHLYFLLIIAFNFFATVLYPKLYMLDNFHKYNLLSYQYTGKSLLSGRNVIWENLVELIKLKPYFGYGSGVNPRDFIESDLSAHNMYLHITLQVGVIGLSLLIIFLFFIWKSFWKNKQDPKVILAACFFIGVLIYQLFEVTLTQNNFGLGLLQWVIIGLGLSYAFNKDEPQSQ